MDERSCKQHLVEIAKLSKELKMYEALSKDELIFFDEVSVGAREFRERRFAEILSKIESVV